MHGHPIAAGLFGGIAQLAHALEGLAQHLDDGGFVSDDQDLCPMLHTDFSTVAGFLLLGAGLGLEAGLSRRCQASGGQGTRGPHQTTGWRCSGPGPGWPPRPRRRSGRPPTPRNDRWPPGYGP